MFHVKHLGLHDALTRRERDDGGDRAAVAVGYVRLTVQRADGHGPHIQHGSSEALPQIALAFLRQRARLALEYVRQHRGAAFRQAKCHRSAAARFACAILKQRRNGIVVY